MLAVMGVSPQDRAAGRFANPSSVYGWGIGVAAGIDEARRTLAGAVGGRPAEICFTSGGTEANNLAIGGLARGLARRGRHLITTAIEHHSVLDACAALEEDGWEVTRLPVDEAGRVRPSDLRDALRPDTVFVTLAHVNNEIGTVQPIAEITAVLRGTRVALVLDAVQALGKVPTPYAAWGVTAVSLSAHKIHGPKGVGALWVRAGTPVRPLVHGGGQQGGLRPGTENVPGIAGFGVAAALALGDPGATARLRNNKVLLWHLVAEQLPGVTANGPDPEDATSSSPHVLNVCFAGCVSRRSEEPLLAAEVLLHRMEQHGLACSAGSACSARRPEPSHVLAAIGLSGAALRSSLRFSLGLDTTAADVRRAAPVIAAAVRQQLALGRGERS